LVGLELSDGGAEHPLQLEFNFGGACLEPGGPGCGPDAAPLEL
jgi:hypothetical protein